jgi:hypothetical protein
MTQQHLFAVQAMDEAGAVDLRIQHVLERSRLRPPRERGSAPAGAGALPRLFLLTGTFSCLRVLVINRFSQHAYRCFHYDTARQV